MAWREVAAVVHVTIDASSTHAATYPLGTGRTYCFSTVSTDAADNVSAPTPERCTTTPVDERSTSASKGWSSKSARGYYRNTYRTSYKKGASLRLTNVNAKTLQLLAAVGPKNGKVTATLGSSRLGTWSLASSRNAHRTITLMNRPTAATGNLVLTISSGDTTVRHGKRVVVTHHPVRIDGITVLR